MTDEELYEMHGLLHKLWSQRVGRYDKKEWMRLDALIGKAILTILGPRCKNGGYMSVITPRESS